MMTVYGLFATYTKGHDMHEVTELIGLFATKELAEKMLKFHGNNAKIKPLSVIENLDWLDNPKVM